eukprot:COSAG01_NODE_2244_length_8081_cov_4.590829_5_plen_183_part_00
MRYRASRSTAVPQYRPPRPQLARNPARRQEPPPPPAPCSGGGGSGSTPSPLHPFWGARMSSPKKKGGKKEPAGNAVNEFDEDAWSATFNQMTKDREEASDAGSIGAREACEMVHKILEGMVRHEPTPHSRLLPVTADIALVRDTDPMWHPAQEKKYNGTMNEALASRAFASLRECVPSRCMR